MKSASCLILAISWLLMFSGCKTAETATGLLDDYDPPKEDFRGAWLTSVVNLDWPVSNEQPVDEQKADAIAMLDSLKDIGINAVLFQVRGESDALYASAYDPWSYWLTGEQGRAPEPFYDPLSFMVSEAHKRGMELHAWLNPYRVERIKGKYDLAGSNISRREPEWILEFASGEDQYYTMLNPGLPEVRDYVTNVVVDIISRYDVDGVHFDDYFYPYSPVTDEDSLTWEEHHSGIEDIEDWRRHNVNELVAQVHDSIQALDPDINFGISPFAIRKNEDAGTDAFEGYYRLYADGQAWLEEQTIDYINPQLYFELEHPRAPYAPLLEYWTRVAYENGLHMYAGLAPYKIFPPTDWTLEQALDQLLLNLENGKVHGNIYFRTEHMIGNPKGYTDFVRDELYRYPALTPSMPWKSQARPPEVQKLSASWSGDGRMILTWADRYPESGEADPLRYAVYKIASGADEYDQLATAENPALSANDELADEVLKAENMIGLTGENQFVDQWPEGRDEAIYLITSVSRNSRESEPVMIRTSRDGDRFTYDAM